jgi:hypothetical protein
MTAETESLPPIFSPQRFFLDAPKQRPGTCFVLNTDFERAMREIERLQNIQRDFHNLDDVETIRRMRVLLQRLHSMLVARDVVVFQRELGFIEAELQGRNGSVGRSPTDVGEKHV